MILAENKAAPLRFLLVVVTGWVVLRGVMLSGWSPLAPRQIFWAPGPGWLARRLLPERPEPVPPVRRASRSGGPHFAATPAARPAPERWSAPVGPLRPDTVAEGTALRLLALVAYDRRHSMFYPRASARHETAPVRGDPATVPLPPPSASRLSGSGWAFVRGGGHARPLSPTGQIGGGQSGVRVLYRLGGGVSAAARLSRTIGGPDQTEAAVGLDWQPVRTVPVHVTIDRRIAIDAGGRDAFALGAAGGVYAVPLAPHWRLDGYGEAGVVGARRRDLYADGAVRAGREVALGDPGGATLTLGFGAWAAAQPHAARLDAGPSAVVRLPVAARTIAVALDYRARITGDARPHSGVALTVGVDF